MSTSFSLLFVPTGYTATYSKAAFKVNHALTREDLTFIFSSNRSYFYYDVPLQIGEATFSIFTQPNTTVPQHSLWIASTVSEIDVYYSINAIESNWYNSRNWHATPQQGWGGWLVSAPSLFHLATQIKFLFSQFTRRHSVALAMRSDNIASFLWIKGDCGYILGGTFGTLG